MQGGLCKIGYMGDRIEHNGIIESIEGDNVRVRIVRLSSCSSCKAKSLCSSSESKDEYIDVCDSSPERWSVGDSVRVCGTLSMGKSAVRIAFGIPVLLMVTVLVVCKVMFSMSDGMSILLMTLCLSAYFTLLYILRDKLNKKFVMWIERAADKS